MSSLILALFFWFPSPLHIMSESLFQEHRLSLLSLSYHILLKPFLITQCILIPLRISNFSTLRPAFLQHSITVFLLAALTSPCPSILAIGSSILSINHKSSLLSLVTSLSINLPPGRRHLFTLSKNACGLG